LCTLLAWAVLFVAPLAPAAFAFDVPPMTGPVVDRAGLLSPSARATLDAGLRRLWNAGGSQIAVLTVDDLGGLPIEQASIQIVDQWKLGTAKGDNGVLLLISRNDRALRIEVGQGLEGSLPDAYARRIIDDVMTPELQSGDFDGAVIDGVDAIMRRTDPTASPLRQGTYTRPEGSRSRGRGNGLLLLIFLGFIIFNAIFGRRRRRYGGWMGGGWGGGGWGGGGWGGGGGFGGGSGGWSGGGGGFSGGGASGRW
jgi:uncharacterized protein